MLKGTGCSFSCKEVPSFTLSNKSSLCCLSAMRSTLRVSEFTECITEHEKVSVTILSNPLMQLMFYVHREADIFRCIFFSKFPCKICEGFMVYESSKVSAFEHMFKMSYRQINYEELPVNSDIFLGRYSVLRNKKKSVCVRCFALDIKLIR